MSPPATSRGAGGRLVRLLVLVVLAIAIVALLFTVVFPWFDRTFLNDPTLAVLRPLLG